MNKENEMYMKMLMAAMAFSCCAVSIADDSYTSTYGSLVDDAGNITLPKDFRSDWAFLGTWSIAEEDVKPAARPAATVQRDYTTCTRNGESQNIFRRLANFPMVQSS